MIAAGPNSIFYVGGHDYNYKHVQTCANIAKKSQIVWAVPKHCEQPFYAVLQGFWQPPNR